MIVAVKRNKKRYLLKIISVIALVGMFSAYYFHMNKSFEEQQKKELESKQALKLQEEEKQKKEKEKKDIETAILTEVEKAVDLIGQEHIRHVKIIEDKVILVCEPTTNLDALMVRYGAMALIKKTLNEIVIAVDINFILKSRLNAK
jgi:hypothetical protein